MDDVTMARDVVLAVDIVLALWFFKLRWYRLSSATVACVAASLIV
jgi:hypothetical protein